MLKVLVTGGRDYANAKRVKEALDEIHSRYGIGKLIHGEARGADSLAGYWAENRGVPVKTFPANWKKHGKRAGHLRNWQMALQGPDVCIAFPGGRGTEGMVKMAYRKSIRVFRVVDEESSPASS